MVRIILDLADKEILRLLLAAQRPLSCNAISSKTGISAQAISRRLFRLRENGVIRVAVSFKSRVYRREYKTKDGAKEVQISAPAKKLWEIDFPEAAK